MVWALILLLIIMFIFSVHLTQTITEFRLEIESDFEEEFPADSHQPAEELASMVRHWGTLPKSIYTLFQIMSGGVSWGDVTRPLVRLHWSYAIWMSAFVAFMAFAVLNIITGLF